MRDLAFLAAWVALVPVAFLGAQYGVILWVWTSLLAPNDLLYGLGSQVPFAKVSAILAIVLLCARRGDIRLRFGWTGSLLLLFALTGIVSQLVSPAADAASGWDLCQKFLKILALALVVLWAMGDRMRVHGLLFAICLGIGFIAVDEGMKFLLSGSSHKIIGSPSIGDNNQVALDVLLIIPLLMYIHNTAAARLVRVACIAGMFFAAVTVIASFSRGGFIGLMVVAVGLMLTGKRKVLGAAMLAILLLCGTALVGSDWTQRMNSVQTAEDDSSFMKRVVAWKVSTALAIERPFTGGGFHAIQHQDVWLSQTRGFNELSIVPTEPQGVFPRAAHSIYFEILGDLGFTGLGLFMMLLAVAWFNTTAVRRAVRRSKRSDLAWAADLAGKLQVSLAAFMVSGGLLSAAYYDIDYLLMALAAVLRVIVSRSLAEQATEPVAAVRQRQPALAQGTAPVHARQPGYSIDPAARGW